MTGFQSLVNKYRIMTLVVFALILTQFNIGLVQAGNCFNYRMNDICYGVADLNVEEKKCSTNYFSDAELVQLDGFFFADRCRTIEQTPKLCDAECDLGQQCQWVDGEEMCVCSRESCSNSLTSDVDRKPICASNNMTFSSLCEMEAWKCLNYRSSLYKKYDGECQKDCLNVKCPENSICVLVKNTGEPICYPKVHCNSKMNPEPICGTDGVTYPNVCALHLKANRKGRTPELAHRGSCEKTCRENLCQDGETCVYSKRGQPVCIVCDQSEEFFRHSGECSVDVPVCGDDGRLYPSYCSMLRRQCQKNRYINIISYQSCPNRRRKSSLADRLNYLI